MSITLDNTNFTYTASEIDLNGSVLSVAKKDVTGSEIMVSTVIDGYPIDRSTGAVADSQNGTIALVDKTAINAGAVSKQYIDLSAGVLGSYANYAGAGLDGMNGGVSTVKFKFIPNFTGSPSLNKYFFCASESLGSLNGAIALAWKTTPNINITIRTSAGAALHSLNVAYVGPSLVADTEYEIELSWDMVAGEMSMHVDGTPSMDATFAGFTRAVTATDIGIGRYYTATFDSLDAWYRDIEIYSTRLHTYADDFSSGFVSEDVAIYDTLTKTLTSDSQNLTTIVTAFSAVSSMPSSTFVKYIGQFSGVDTYFDTVLEAWIPSDGTLAQSNDAAGVVAGLNFLNIDEVGILIVKVLMAASELETPTFTSLTYTEFAPTIFNVPICILYGYLIQDDGTPATSGTLEFKSKPYHQGNSLIVIHETIEADTTGYYQVVLAQGSVEAELKVKITIVDEEGDTHTVKYNLLIPNQSNATLESTII